MKATLTFEATTAEKLNMLIKIATAIGIKVFSGNKAISEYKVEHELSIVSEPSLLEAWDSKEDDRWDELYGNK